MTLALSIASGISGGFIAGLSIWQPVHSLYRDDDHFWEVVPKYPNEYLVGGDEVYDEAKGTFQDIQAALTARRQTIDGDAKKQIDEMVDTIWEESAGGKNEMTRAETKDFITKFVKSTDHRLEVSNAAFEQIFNILDMDKNGCVDQRELKAFITKFTTGQ